MPYDPVLKLDFRFSILEGPVNSARDPQKKARHKVFSFLGSVWIPFIVENWKHCGKIIFKCVNSTVGPSFKVKFMFFRTYGSREQCMGPSQKNSNAQNATPAIIQTHTWCNPNSIAHLDEYLWYGPIFDFKIKK